MKTVLYIFRIKYSFVFKIVPCIGDDFVKKYSGISICREEKVRMEEREEIEEGE